MVKKKEPCRAANGLFVRNLGWKLTPTGGYAQHKFYLGRDESKAKLASLRLEQLWEQVCQRRARDHRSDLHAPNRPVWDEVTLAIAEAVRNGAAVARIPLPVPFSAMIPESPLIGDWLERLQNDITVIKVELLDETAQEHSEEFLQKQGQQLLDRGRRLLHQRAGGETLRAALDAYSRWIASKYLDVAKQPTAWAGTQSHQVAFLSRHLPDCPLSAFDAQRVEELIEVLRLRPSGADGQPVSVAWTQNCIKQFRHFLRWLNKAPEFAWKRPADLELSPVRIPLTAQEQSARARSLQVETYTRAELQTLWQNASPFQRLLLLLALNCGFGRAEIASLEVAEVLLRQPHPHAGEVGYPSSAADSWVLRLRHKTGVYGEHKLWPETVRAVEWWLRQRSGLGAACGVTTLLLTRTGRRYDAPSKGNHPNFQIPRSWFRLCARIRKVHPDFRQLSFNKLRKTAANLIRAESRGEIAGVFLCHGTPLKADELLDVYTNRPFGRVFEALERVGEKLRPLWAGVSEPFPEPPLEDGAKLSRGTIRRIQALHRQGYKTDPIAAQLGLTVETVRRWAKQSAALKGPEEA
jgi:integrase